MVARVMEEGELKVSWIEGREDQHTSSNLHLEGHISSLMVV